MIPRVLLGWRSASWVATSALFLAARPATLHAQCSYQRAFRLTAFDGAPGDGLGGAVALDGAGRVALVGASGDDDLGLQCGGAYLFALDGAYPALIARLQPSDLYQGEVFGAAVALDSLGERAVVGCPGDSDMGPSSGSAYVFRRVGAAWVQETKLIAPSMSPGERFGSSVAISASGERILIGTPCDRDLGTDSGSVHVFGFVQGAWKLEAKLHPTSPGQGDLFGFAVDVSADGLTALVGAPLDDGAHHDSGAAYLFTQGSTTGGGGGGTGSDGLWSLAARVFPADGHKLDGFGASVALDGAGANAVIGAPGALNGGCPSGAAHLYRPAAGGWSEAGRWTAQSGLGKVRFGASVAIDAGARAVLVGSPGALGSGAAWCFADSGRGFDAGQQITSTDLSGHALFGGSVALSDAGHRMLIGAALSAPWSSLNGAAYLMKRPQAFTYCTGKKNSLGCTPQVASTGCQSTQLASGFEITATGVLENRPGIFFYGTSGPSAASFQGGTLCVQPMVVRTPVQDSGTGGLGPCRGVLRIDFNAWVASGIDPSLVAGQRVNGQFWYRDPQDPSTTGLSDAIELTLDG